MAQSLISINDLHVSFGRTRILHGVSLDVPAGQTIALVGANGSGKSTLLRALMRLELPDAGSGTVLGRSILGDDSDYNRDLGYVSETLEYQLPVKLKAIAALYAEMRPDFKMSEFERVAGLFHLPLDKRASEYSRGQKMQFAFALLVASKPKLILLDEITAVLDLHVRDLVMREVREMTATGSSALIATNILTEVLPYADRLLILENGRVALDTSLAELSETYLKLKSSRGFTEAPPSGFRAIKGSADGRLTYLVPRSLVTDLTSRPPGLEPASEPITGEDVFLYHCRKGA